MEMARGVLVGGGLALAGVVAGRVLAEEPWTDRAALAGPVVGAAVGAIAGFIRPVRWIDVARSVDRRYRLHDATETAWQLAELGRDEPIVQLQVLRATERVEQLAPSDQLAWQLPKSAQWGLVLWLVAVAISLAPKAAEPARASQDAADLPSPQTNRAVAEAIEKTVLSDLQRLADRAELPKPEVRRLKSLQRELKASVERIRKPDQSSRAVLKELSLMQAQLAEVQAELRTTDKEHAFAEVAESLATADELQSVAEVLEKKDYQQAANQLSQVDPRPADPEAREQLKQALEDASEEIGQAGDKNVADAVESLREAMDQADAQQAQQLAQPLGQVLQDEALRLAVQQQLMIQLAALSEAKAMAQDGGKNTAKSDESRETWGKGDAGDPMKGESRMPEATSREREELTGVAGEGQLDRRRVQRPVEEDVESSSVVPREAQREFQQSAEEALRSESLPLSHRRTIRDYFRAIHSQDQ